MAARSVTRLTRTAVLAAVVLMGGALLLTGWATYTAVGDASATLVRGQADAIEQAVRADLGPTPPTEDELQGFLADHAQAGVRFAAYVDPFGHVQAQAGSPASGLPREIGEPEPFRRALEVVGGRVRLEVPLRRMRRGGGGGPGRIVVELEPVQARALRTSAARTFGIGAVAATALLALAIALVRWILKREALELKLAQERRLAALGEMSAVLAHEIRNPLASLKGNAQLLAEQLPSGEKARQKAERVVAEAVRLETLTNDLLAFVRTGELRRTPTDPAALLREVARDLEVEVDDTGAPKTWSLDPDRTRQVLRNLLDNAVAAGPPVRARVARSDAGLLFEVLDRGPGVAREDVERIFEPFFTRRTQGTGLGLAVSKRIVELHGGAIEVGEAPGGGACFRVTIPEG